MHNKNSFLGSFYAILAGFLYGFLGYFGASLMQEGLSIPNLTFWRFALSAICLIPLLLFYKNEHSKNIKQCLLMVSFGAIFYCISPLLFFMGSRHIGTGLSMVLFFCYPAVVMVVETLKKKKRFEKKYLLSICTIFIGISLLVDYQSFNFNVWGISLSLLSGVFYALYILGSQNIALPSLLATFMVSCGCSFTTFISALLDQSFQIDLSFRAWMLVIGFGIFSTAIPILLFLKSLQYISGTKASLLSVLEPVFVVILGVWLLSEDIHMIQYVGIIFILSGAFLSMIKSPAVSKQEEHSVISSNHLTENKEGFN